MKNVFRVGFDIKVNGQWASGTFMQEWASRDVIVEGDARAACDKIASDEFKRQYDDIKATDIRIVNVQCVATNILEL